MEGYNRNRFYLAQLVKKYDCIFIFLQEHWLPHHETEQLLKNDFKSYDFLSTSSDMFLPSEDVILQRGPTWHGTAIAWNNKVDSKIKSIPVISERFCGVICQDCNIRVLHTLHTFLPVDKMKTS